jgi:hypothetical protein
MNREERGEEMLCSRGLDKPYYSTNMGYKKERTACASQVALLEMTMMRIIGEEDNNAQNS